SLLSTYPIPPLSLSLSSKMSRRGSIVLPLSSSDDPPPPSLPSPLSPLSPPLSATSLLPPLPPRKRRESLKDQLIGRLTGKSRAISMEQPEPLSP
ncbi:hypothetical protein PRIPAC_85322, partial [Pristionchus pacificus]